MNEEFFKGKKIMTKEDLEVEADEVELEHLKELEAQRAEESKMTGDAIEDQINERLISDLESQQQADTQRRILDEVTEKKEEDGGEYRNG